MGAARSQARKRRSLSIDLFAEGVDHPFDLEGMLPHGEERLAEEDGVADHSVEEVFEVSLDDGEGIFELDSDVGGEGRWGSPLGVGAFIAEGDSDEPSGFAEPDGNEGDLEVPVVAPCVSGEAEGDAEDGGLAGGRGFGGREAHLAVAEEGVEFSAEDAALGAEHGLRGVVGEDNAVESVDDEAGVGKTVEDLFHAWFGTAGWRQRIAVFGAARGAGVGVDG